MIVGPKRRAVTAQLVPEVTEMAHAARAARSDPARCDSARSDPGREAAVWSDTTGRPTRLIWEGRRWRVTDRPTVITAPISWWWRCDPEGRDLDLAPRECVGWRFQATTETGESWVFDICDTGDASRWKVVKTYR